MQVCMKVLIWCTTNKCTQNSGVKISGVTYSDIHGSSASQVAVKFDCSASKPCTGIGLQDIKLTYSGGSTPAESSCNHADGTASGLIVPPSCLWRCTDHSQCFYFWILYMKLEIWDACLLLELIHEQLYDFIYNMCTLAGRVFMYVVS